MSEKQSSPLTLARAIELAKVNLSPNAFKPSIYDMIRDQLEEAAIYFHRLAARANEAKATAEKESSV